MRNITIALGAAMVGSLAHGQTFGHSATDRAQLDLAYQITFIDAGSASPAAGKVTSWSLFAKGAGDVTLQIWRPLGGGSFQLIGANPVTAALGLNTFNVGVGDQISILAGDVLGFRYNQTLLGNRVIAFDFGGGQTVWTNWPEPSGDVAIGGTLSNLTGSTEARTYSLNATVTPVPEPTTFAALIGAGLLLVRRRRH